MTRALHSTVGLAVAFFPRGYHLLMRTDVSF